MEEKEEPRNAAGQDLSRTRAAQDGAIDFARYSSEQLGELQDTLDRHTFPRNFANLLAEVERRRASQQPATNEPEPPGQPPAAVVTGRFTAHDGLRGWLEAKSRRLAVYGDGFIDVRPEEVVVGGWCHNWLGIAQRTELFIPLNHVSDVVQADEWLHFRYERPFGHRSIAFRAGSVQQASALAAALPAARSDNYERWTAVREFDTRLRTLGHDPWITAAIVIANVAIFIAMTIALRTPLLLQAPQMIAWGANFGPQTLHGQWWRLVTALFLHGNIAHVGFNMWALWNVGRLTERLYGNWTYAFLYLAGGVLAGLASIVWDPSRPTLGASGAIFGIFGAFIAFSLHPRSRVLVKIPAALWISTLVFALYNLVAGFFAPGIDNAAHVGGLLSGLLLGALMARPLDAGLRRPFPLQRVVAAAALTTVAILTALWQARGFGDQLTIPESYFRAHLWYASGEGENIRTWQEIAAESAAGRLSSATVGERFEREIVPFWEMAASRLKTETPTLPATERAFGALVTDFARLRFEWSRAIVDASVGNNRDRESDAVGLEKQTDLAVARIERVALLAGLEHRSRALKNSRWLDALRRRFTKTDFKCVEPPPAVSKPPLPSDSRTDGPAARQAAGCQAQQLFLSEKYVALEEALEKAAAALTDLPDGSSTLTGIAAGLANLFAYGKLDLMQTLGQAADFQRSAPHSLYPVLIESMIFESWAWAVRGNGAANSVSPQTWMIFAHRTEMAAMGLHEIAARAGSNPLWYELSLDVGLDQSKTVDDLRPTFDRGIAEEPEYWPLYSRMLRILMPRWLGSPEEINRFIREVAFAPFGAKKDYAKYARLYWMYSSLERDDVKLFDGPFGPWSTMRMGWVTLQRQYPHSDLILNAYAKFACMADDEISYTEVRPKLEGRLSSTAWSDKVSLVSCDGKFAAAAAAVRGHTFTAARFRLN